MTKREQAILRAVAAYKDDLRFETEERPGGADIKRIYVVENDHHPKRNVYIRYKDDEYTLLPVLVKGYIHLGQATVKHNKNRLLEQANRINEFELYMSACLVETGVILSYQIPAVVNEDLENILREVLCTFRLFFGRDSEWETYNDADRKMRIFNWKMFLERIGTSH